MKSTHYTYEGGNELYLRIIGNQPHLLQTSTIPSGFLNYSSLLLINFTYWCTTHCINQLCLSYDSSRWPFLTRSWRWLTTTIFWGGFTWLFPHLKNPQKGSPAELFRQPLRVLLSFFFRVWNSTGWWFQHHLVNYTDWWVCQRIQSTTTRAAWF